MSTNTSTPIRRILQGHKLLIVGGDPRDKALSRLAHAFDFAKVIHCRTRKSDASTRCFKSRLYEPDIVLVVCLVGLCRTHHVEHLHRLCRELGMPWIDCHRIPHPNALLARIETLRLLNALQKRSEQTTSLTVSAR